MFCSNSKLRYFKCLTEMEFHNNKTTIYLNISLDHTHRSSINFTHIYTHLKPVYKDNKI